MVFAVVWLTIVYFPIAHMVWAGNGLFFTRGALDFAGGTVVHINSGVSALVACLILGKRLGYPREPMPPHRLTMTGIGTGLLWVGWFGFNAGSALEANGVGRPRDDQHLRRHRRGAASPGWSPSACPATRARRSASARGSSPGSSR